MHVQIKKYGIFGKCAAQKFKNFCSSSLWTCLHHIVPFELHHIVPLQLHHIVPLESEGAKLPLYKGAV